MIKRLFRTLFSFPEKKEVELPHTCLLTVSNACPMRCMMCDLWQAEDARIDTATFKKITDELAAGGTREMHLIGGETFSDSGIFEMIRYAADKDIRVVATSSGFPIDAELSRKIGESGLSFLNLSIDSLDETVHDKMRGRQGAHKRVMQAAEHMREHAPDTELAVNTIISKVNYSGLPALTRWVHEHDCFSQIYFMAVMKPFASDLGDDWYLSERGQKLWPQDSAKLNNVLDELIRMKNDGFSIGNSVGQFEVYKRYFNAPDRPARDGFCPLDTRAININAHGDAYICFFKEKLGNIRENSITDMWNSSTAQSVREEISGCRQNCELVLNCYFEG